MDTRTFWSRCSESQAIASYYVLASDAWDGTGGFAAPLDDIVHSCTGAAQPTLPAEKERSYILRHPQEDHAKWAWRVRNATYSNFVRSFGETLLGFLFSRIPHREWPAGTDDKEWSLDVDGLGTSLDDYERDVATRLLLHGTSWTTIDRTAGTWASLAEARAAGAREYVYQENPSSVYDWRTGPRGDQNAVKLVDEQTTGGIEEEVSRYYRCRIMVPGAWREYRATNKSEAPRLESEVPIPAAVGLPIVCQRLDRQVSGGILGTTIFRQLCDEQLGIYREMSLLFEHLHMQGFAILAKPKMSGAQPAAVVVGSDNCLEFDKEGSPPSFIAPPSTVAESLFKAIAVRLERMRAMVGLDAITGGTQAESGIARAWRFSPLNRRLVAISRAVDAWERAVLTKRAAWAGRDPRTALNGYKCERAEDFDVRDVESAIKRALDLEVLRPYLGPIAWASLMRSLRTDVVTVDPEQVEDSDKEIDDAAADMGADVARDTATGTPGDTNASGEDEPPSRRCAAVLRDGGQCRNAAVPGSSYCRVHGGVESGPQAE